MQANITIMPNVKDTETIHYKPITLALTRIQSGKSKETVEALRETGDKLLKLKLPVVLFSGEFKERRDDAMIDHSGYIVLDFDHIEDVEDVKRTISLDQYIYSVWVSPSGTGLKALVKIKFPERHRDQFRGLVSYFDKQYGLEVDGSGINESRACFESYDPNIVIKDNSDVFTGILTERSERQQVVQSKVALGTDYTKLAIAARMIANAPDGKKHEVLRNAAVLVGGYIGAGTVEEDEGVRILQREIFKRDLDSEDQARTTIRDGIEHGKKMPIAEVISEENRIIKETDLDQIDFNFLSSDDDDFDWIQKFAEGHIIPGLDTGNEHWDKYFRYKKELLVANGHSNVGKTTVMLYLIMNSAIRHQWKWVLYSAENKTALLKKTLMEFLVDRRIDTMTFQERKMAFNWVQEHFTIISNKEVYGYKDLILMCEKLRRSQQVDAFFIDPYNALKIQMSGHNNLSTHEYHYEAISEFLTYTEANDMATWVNMHAASEAQRRKGDDGLPVAPYAEDTEGGGKMVNRPSTFITIHRKIQHPEHHIRRTSEIHVRKVRTTELGGSPTPIDEPLLLKANSDLTGFYTNNGDRLYAPKILTLQEQKVITNLELSDISFNLD
jgi:hypothetical protein